MKLQTIQCLVACTNSEGQPELILTRISVTAEQIENGEHYPIAKEQVENEGYNDPCWVADEFDPGFQSRINPS